MQETVCFFQVISFDHTSKSSAAHNKNKIPGMEELIQNIYRKQLKNIKGYYKKKITLGTKILSVKIFNILLTDVTSINLVIKKILNIVMHLIYDLLLG